MLSLHLQQSAADVSLDRLEELTCLPPARFIFGFESLGEGSTFGLLQRRCGADPATLLRFAACPLPVLLHGLRTRFEKFVLPENLEAIPPQRDGQDWRIQDTALQIEYRTWVVGDDDHARTLVAHCTARLPFLKRKLIGELQAGRKVFVWGRPRPARQRRMEAVHAAMRAYGDNTLLWAAQSDADHHPGTVERIAPGLLKGHVDHLAEPGQALPGWLAACVGAHLARKHDADLPAPARLAGGTSAPRPARPARIVAHVQNRGDVQSDVEGWAGCPGSHLAIEGFALSDHGGAPHGAVTYRVLLDADTLSPPAGVGDYSGSRGQGRPVHGFVVVATGLGGAPLRVTCEARFTDGTGIGPVAAGILCRAPSGSLLEALRIMIGHDGHD